VRLPDPQRHPGLQTSCHGQSHSQPVPTRIARPRRRRARRNENPSEVKPYRGCLLNVRSWSAQHGRPPLVPMSATLGHSGLLCRMSDCRHRARQLTADLRADPLRCALHMTRQPSHGTRRLTVRRRRLAGLTSWASQSDAGRREVDCFRQAGRLAPVRSPGRDTRSSTASWRAQSLPALRRTPI
jgi:hypothetical protein